MRRRIALLLAAFLTPALAIYSVFTIVSRSDEGFGEWQRMEARQVSVPLAPGTVAVEIADLESGWTERVSVQSDGRRVLSGIPESVEADVSQAYRRLGMHRLDVRPRGGWVAIVLQASW